jgi:hypothetical protein
MSLPATEPGIVPALPPRRSRRRIVLWTVAVLVVIGLPVTDVTSRQVVQRAFADRMQSQLNTPQRPSVYLDGTPFLTQLISGEFQRVRLEARDVTACHARIAHARAVLTGVRRQSGGIAVDSISGDGLLSYADLSAAVAPLRISAGGPGQVTVSGGLGSFGFTAAAAPRIDGSTLVVEPVAASATTGFGPSLGGNLSALPPLRIQLRQIPAGLNLSLDPGADGLAFTFGGQHLALPAMTCPGG